jgi:hypothetical protein
MSTMDAARTAWSGRRFAKERLMSTIDAARTARAGGAVATTSRPNWSSAVAKAVASVLVFAAPVCAARPASAQFTQQGQKLFGTGAVGAAEQGSSVALSGDGDTAIVGGPADNSNAGAAWVFSQNGGVWTQAGPKLIGNGAGGTTLEGRSVALSADGDTAIVGGPENNSNAGAAWVFSLGANLDLFGSGAAGAAAQGYSVALSASGNTAIVGGPSANSSAGAAWVFTRSGSTWTPQGPKLSGGGAVGGAEQGFSVALSADGNTAIVGGPYDNSQVGAVWVFTQSSGVWTQQGSKLVASDAVGAANQGQSVALSADGNTAIVGGPYDNSGVAGAAWVFTRSSNGAWTQQGLKLVGSGAVAPDLQGSSVALSADGNTAIVGGYVDNSGVGAAWVFTRSGSTWSQQGSKLVGTGAAGAAGQGYSVALSADGNTAIIGGYSDNSGIGATWVFTRSGGVWTQQGSKLVGNGAVNTPNDAQQGSSVALSADGTTALVGGPYDNAQAGAAWVFASPSHIAGLLSASPTSGSAPLAVTFRATGLPLPMTYTINFGDGTSGALSQGGCFGSRSGVQCSGSASHSYAGAGTYYATLVNASGGTLGAATITAGGNLVRPLRPPLLPRGVPVPPSPPLAIATPPSGRHSLDR